MSPRSQTWRTFLENHADCLASDDFFTVATAAFRVLYVFVVLRHDRRRVVHFNVTAHPTGEWTSRQIVQAFPYDEAPRYLIRDRDGIYGDSFQTRVKHMGIEQVLIAPRPPTPPPRHPADPLPLKFIWEPAPLARGTPSSLNQTPVPSPSLLPMWFSIGTPTILACPRKLDGPLTTTVSLWN